MPIRLYHPELTPPHNECEVFDELQVAVLAESGWERVPEPVVQPGYAPTTRYEPVTPTADKPKRTTKTEPKGEDTTS